MQVCMHMKCAPVYCMHRFIDLHVGGTEFAEYIIGASLSEPHINGLYIWCWPGRYGVCVCAGIYICQFWPLGCQGPHCVARCENGCRLQTFRIFPAECFK